MLVPPFPSTYCSYLEGLTLSACREAMCFSVCNIFTYYQTQTVFYKKSPICLRSLSSEHFRKELFIIVIKWKGKWSSLDFVTQTINSREMLWTPLFAQRLVPSPVWTLLGTAWWLLPFYRKMQEVTNGVMVICHRNFSKYFTEMKTSHCISPEPYSVIKFPNQILLVP